MRIRDPIHGIIHVSDEEKEVIDSRAFQRLRTVRQLGFGELAFPGATHTRHAHSLGAMHVASRLFDVVSARAGLAEPVRLRFRAAVRLAVLCHDLGHMPFSHASEAIAPPRVSLGLPAWMGPSTGRASHEDFTAKILWDSSLTPLLERRYGPLGITPGLVAGLITGRLPAPAERFEDGGVDWTPLLRAIVTGELDADRMDYLQRDSFYTGVNYGRFDAEWLMSNLSAEQRDGQAVLALSRAAIFAFEDFLLSRYHMFLSVYYHHTSVSFDHMLKRFYDEAQGEFEVPSEMERFLGCDDVTLLGILRASKNEWAQRIVTRRGYKRVVQFTERDVDYDLGHLSKALEDAGIAHFEVESVGTLSRYLTDGGSPSLYVVDTATGRLTEIAKYTPLYERFNTGVKLSRLYAKPEQAAEAKAVVAKLTQGRGLPDE